MRVRALRCRRREGLNTLARAIEAGEVRLRILHNNAGPAWGLPVETHPIEQVDRLLQVKVGAVHGDTRCRLPDNPAGPPPARRTGSGRAQLAR